MSYKILTVDDSKMVRMIVSKSFAPYGCEIHEACNGVEGLARAAEILPDIIFLDITMADMNGLEMLNVLRQTEGLQNIPVVMLTAESGMNSIERADALKVIGYVPKPFKSERLIEVASTVLKLEPIAAA
jgi:CheY-like chemotaxis protein